MWYRKFDQEPANDTAGAGQLQLSQKTPEVVKHPVAAKVQGISKPHTDDPVVEAAFQGNTDEATIERVVQNEAQVSKLGIWQRKTRSLFAGKQS